MTAACSGISKATMADRPLRTSLHVLTEELFAVQKVPCMVCAMHLIVVLVQSTSLGGHLLFPSHACCCCRMKRCGVVTSMQHGKSKWKSSPDDVGLSQEILMRVPGDFDALQLRQAELEKRVDDVEALCNIGTRCFEACRVAASTAKETTEVRTENDALRFVACKAERAGTLTSVR
eukprot:5262947-Amphidinium_carterae.1